MTGRYESVEAKRVALSPGWLLMVHPFQETMKAWEMHPLGDEILYLLSGEMDLIFEEDRKERHLELKAGSTCIVPKGIWHRQIVLSPGKLLGVTYGKNTQHKQL
jgi:mannose-6-phosphate isomerase-like protein (cupin superfamily)